jgi:hypothetical protein
MDIKVNAQGSYVEIIGINESTSLDYATGVAYDLWAATVSEKEKDPEGLSAGTGSYVDRPQVRLGFADMRSGERLAVK